MLYLTTNDLLLLHTTSKVILGSLTEKQRYLFFMFTPVLDDTPLLMDPSFRKGDNTMLLCPFEKRSCNFRKHNTLSLRSDRSVKNIPPSDLCQLINLLKIKIYYWGTTAYNR